MRYEVKLKYKGDRFDLTFDSSGGVVEVEKEIDCATIEDAAHHKIMRYFNSNFSAIPKGTEEIFFYYKYIGAPISIFLDEGARKRGERYKRLIRAAPHFSLANICSGF
jgi:hypothetical protein